MPPRGFNQTELEYLQANYQPLQNQERLPHSLDALRELAMNIIVGLLVFCQLFVLEVLYRRTWIWLAKTMWTLACLYGLLRWGRVCELGALLWGRVCGSGTRKIHNRSDI